jgi:tetratricopeptide (TPR) repeat protein
VAIRASNLGSVLLELGDPEGAKAQIERALRIDEQVYGPEHPNVATDANNLGLALKALGDLEGAKAHIERALRILEKSLPEGHPSIGIVRENLEEVMMEMEEK